MIKQNNFIAVYRFIFRIRYWLIAFPLVATLLAIAFTHNMRKVYQTNMLIYTGVISGYDVEATENSTSPNWVASNNAMDNILNIMSSRSTLENVSMKLYAQHMVHGDPNSNNKYITARKASKLFNSTPLEVKQIIDRNSEERTINNLNNYKVLDKDNYVYGLFNYYHPDYSFESLSKNIKVKQLGSSDIIQVTYTNDDPGIAYNTLLILNTEFKKSYEQIRYGITNRVIRLFEKQLDSLGTKLRVSEDILTEYSVDKRIINYEEQTKFISSLKRDYALVHEEVLRNLKSSENSLRLLDAKIDDNIKSVRANAEFVSKLNEISNLSTRLAMASSQREDEESGFAATREMYGKSISNSEKELKDLALTLVEKQSTREGVSKDIVVEQWITELIRNEKAKAELTSINKTTQALDDDFIFYAPVGSTLGRLEREISFVEKSYINTLNALNTARLREKNLQLTASVLRTISPPVYPLNNEPTKRKYIVLITALATFFFILTVFILIELLDHTLRNKERTERVTGGRVLGAFPKHSLLKRRIYNTQIDQLCAKNIATSINGYFKQGQLNVVNIISTQSGEGKSHIASLLKECWSEEYGLNVKRIVAGVDFDPNDKHYYLAEKLSDFYTPTGEDVLIVEHPELSNNSIPYDLFGESAFNLWIVRSDRVWIDRDQLIFDRLNSKYGQTPTLLCINFTDRYVPESFVGMLPPYNLLSKLRYMIYNLGLTSNV